MRALTLEILLKIILIGKRTDKHSKTPTNVLKESEDQQLRRSSILDTQRDTKLTVGL